MNCTEVKELLSAYYDAEVSAIDRATIADHLRNCSECSAVQAGFEQLSGMVHRLASPVPPEHGWQRLQAQLDGEQTIDAAERVNRPDRSARPGWLGYRMIRPVLAVAALLLVALGWFGIDAWFHHGDHELLAADFEHYVDEFQRDPDAAQRMLNSKYKGQAVEIDDAVPRISYRPIAAKGLPSGYELDSMHLLQMPCCDCLQTVCRRSDGSKFVIFEYGEEQPVTAGERSAGMTHCSGEGCCLVAINDKFAASWKHGEHRVSLVGVRDQAEKDLLVASLD